MFDLRGQLLSQQQSEQGAGLHTALADLPQGTYFVRVQLGTQASTQKLVKE